MKLSMKPSQYADIQIALSLFALLRVPSDLACVCSPTMMKTFITRRGEGQGKTKKERKATKSKGRGLEEGASRALMRQHGEEGCGERG